MIRRVFKRKRPRGFALLATVASILVAAGLVAATALALETDAGTYSVEVTAKEFSSPLVQLTQTPGDGSALVTYIGSSAQNQSSGTGLFDPFVRLQGALSTAPTETGYNTCAQQNPCGGDVSEFETKPGSWTHAIKASAIPVVDCETNGDVTTTERCWELFVDINEGNNDKYISLTTLEIYFTRLTDGTITNYPFTASEATLQYEFNGEIKIHDVNQGSGRGDLLYLVPVQPFVAADWFVLYSEWGSLDGSSDGKTYASEGGFEEWKVRKAPNVTILKTEDAASVNAGSNIGFTVTVTNTGAADATGVTINDPLPGGPGIDWSENPDNPNCSISGSPPNETLNCGPVTLAAGTGSISVHVQSSTTAASCGTYPNTATFTSTNAGTGSDSASVTVNCGAIRILKNSTKGGAVSQFGTVFGVDGPDTGTGADFNVTDDDADPFVRDRDAAKGVVCVGGLEPGATYTVTEVTPPTGYGTGTAVDATAVAVAGSCSTASFGTANVATFSNPPTFDIQVNFRDGGSGETNVNPPTGKIDCDNNGAGADTPDGTAASGWHTSVTHSGLTVSPGPTETIVCTIVVDP